MWAVALSDDVSYYEGTSMSSDPFNEAELIELNQVTTEVLARLPHLRVIDKLTVVRKCQHLALIVDAGDPTYLEKFG